MSDPLFRTGFRSPLRVDPRSPETAPAPDGGSSGASHAPAHSGSALQKLLGRLMSWLTGRPLTWPAWAQGTWARLTGSPTADTAALAPFTLGQLFEDTLPVRPSRPARAGAKRMRRQRVRSASARPPAEASSAADSPSAATVRSGNWASPSARRTGPRRYKH